MWLQWACRRETGYHLCLQVHANEIQTALNTWLRHIIFIYMHAHTHTHARMHARTHTRTHAHTHTHTTIMWSEEYNIYLTGLIPSHFIYALDVKSMSQFKRVLWTSAVTVISVSIVSDTCRLVLYTHTLSLDSYTHMYMNIAKLPYVTINWGYSIQRI